MRISLQRFIVCLICVLLYASTTYSASTLRYYFIHDQLKHEYWVLWPAAKNGSSKNLQTLVELATQYEDKYWLKQAASINSLSAQVALAALSENTEKRHWLRRASHNGHAPSQFELSLLEDSVEQRIRYLEQAAFNQYAPAIIALSNIYYEQKDTDKAVRYLIEAAQFDHSSSVKLARIYWQQGEFNKAKETFKAVSSTQPDADQYYRAIHQIKRSDLTMLALENQGFGQNCSQYIQFVATTLDSVVQATRFKQNFESDNSLDSLPICIAPIIWLKPDQLNCELSNERQACDLGRLANLAFTPNYTHIVFFLETGKAYVQDGAMYLDQADTYSVFVHELAHFVGFVDEYAVNPELSEQYCRLSTAPNLVISHDTDIHTSNDFALWRQYVQEINQQRINAINAQQTDDLTLLALEIDESRTCSKLEINAYKPSNKMTFMEFHDTNNIPPLYQYMWKRLLQKYHHNIAVSELFAKQSQLNNPLRTTGD